MEITRRDEASQVKRQETISKAEQAIDAFYKEYAAKKEKTIAANKSVVHLYPCRLVLINSLNLIS